MLLELIGHHPGLFHAVIRALISAGKWRHVAALRASCRRFCDQISNLDEWKHRYKFMHVLRNVRTIGKFLRSCEGADADLWTMAWLIEYELNGPARIFGFINCYMSVSGKKPIPRGTLSYKN